MNSEFDSILEEQDEQLKGSGLNDDEWSGITHPDARGFHGDLTGEDFETAAARDAAENREALRRSARNERNLIDDPNYDAEAEAEQARQFFEQAVKTDQQRALEIRQEEAAKLFLELHPECLANPANGRVWEFAARTKGIQPATVQEIEQLYEELVDAGMLQIDQNALAKQEQDARAKTARKMRSTGVSTRGGVRRHYRTPEEEKADLYNMPEKDFFRIADGDQW